MILRLLLYVMLYGGALVAIAAGVYRLFLRRRLRESQGRRNLGGEHIEVCELCAGHYGTIDPDVDHFFAGQWQHKACKEGWEDSPFYSKERARIK